MNPGLQALSSTGHNTQAIPENKWPKNIDKRSHDRVPTKTAPSPGRAGPLCYTWFLGPRGVHIQHIQNSTLIGSAVFVGLTVDREKQANQTLTHWITNCINSITANKNFPVLILKVAPAVFGYTSSPYIKPIMSLDYVASKSCQWFHGSNLSAQAQSITIPLFMNIQHCQICAVKS